MIRQNPGESGRAGEDDETGLEAPPSWFAPALAAILRHPSRDSIVGDLIETYREDVRAARGPLRARLWCLHQIASLSWRLSPIPAAGRTGELRVGFGLGALLSVAAVGFNVILPMMRLRLPDLEALQTAGWLLLFLFFAIQGRVAFRHSRRMSVALRAGAVTAGVSFGMTMLTFLMIDLLFRETVSRQPEKILLFQHSGRASIQAYLLSTDISAILFVLPTLALAGALAGVVGAVGSKVTDAIGR